MSASAPDDAQLSLWKRFIYSGNNNSTDPLILSQLLFVNSFSLLAFISVTVFGIVNVFGHDYSTGVAELICGALFLGNMIFFRFNKNLSLAKTFLLLTEGVLLLVLLITGGIDRTGVYWFFTFPIATYFLLGREKGIIWNLCFCISILSLSIFSSQQGFPLAYTFIEIRQLLSVLFVVNLLVITYQQVITKTQQKLIKSEGQTRRMMELTEQEKVRDEALLASIGEGMLVVDKTGALLILNKVAQDAFHIKESEVVGKYFADLISVQDPIGKPLTNDQRPMYRALSESKVIKGEYIFTRRDGLSFPVSIVATPVIINNKTIGAIGLFRDITEEKVLDKAKTEFVALASHQLRTPISAISWFAEMLLHGDIGNLTKEQQEQVLKIYQSNKRMTTMVDSLLNVSQLELGGFSIKPQKIILADFIHTVIEEERKQLDSEKKLAITEQYDKSLGEITVDPDIIRIIFRNLIANAIKYTPSEGKVTVLLENSADGILGKISDTGYGIPKNQQDKIFTKLFRAENGKKRETDGMGLGLYIVKSILEQIGGKVWFETNENKGSTFFVLLPKEGMKERKGEKSLVGGTENTY